MVLVPKPATTPAPHPSLLFEPVTSSMGSGPAAPSATAVPAAPTPLPKPETSPSDDGKSGGSDAASKSKFPLPKLRLEVRDVMQPGAHRFLSLIDASTVLPDAVANVQRLLYNKPGDHTTHMTPTRSVTVVLRDMDGVAYTTGSDLDDDHKEIHFSLRYIAGIRPGDGDLGSRIVDEITGVLTHELVHCYQWNGKGSCPGGLIEGIADYVRLKCDLSPPHWKRNLDGPWDRGYEKTGFFLSYLESRFGADTVRRINEKLRKEEYREKPFWTELLGGPVHQLWNDYVEKSRQDDETKG